VRTRVESRQFRGPLPSRPRSAASQEPLALLESETGDALRDLARQYLPLYPSRRMITKRRPAVRVASGALPNNALRYIMLVCVGIATLFGGITWLALEGNDVVRLHTRRADGGVRVTRVWITEGPDEAWVEAATPQRPFYIDLLKEPRVEVERRGHRRAFVAESVANPEGHLRVRALLGAKYGWADAWIGLLQDTSASVGVRLKAVNGVEE
jgi:hypothetical protein